MSAWLCSQEHINLLVNASKHPREQDFDMLVKENLRSLEARYPGRDFLDEWKTHARTFKFRADKPSAIVSTALVKNADHVRGPIGVDSARVTATQIVKAADCYDYQACETDDYNTTQAAKYVTEVRKQAVAAGGESTGKLYDALLWGFD
jgi:hypothetical protein